jgi:cytidylate kinase
VGERKNIAIDGPAGSGKSTIGKLLSEKLSYQFLDSGLLFRYFAKFCLDFDKNLLNYSKKEGGEQPSNFLIRSEKTLNKLLHDWEKELIRDKEKVISWLERERKTLNSREVSSLASQLATIRPLRKIILNFQRELAEKKGWVIVGRDITSEVLPEAEVKILLTASLEARAERRYQEYEKKNDLTSIKEELLTRDERDKNRLISPLIKTADSWQIDTTYLSPTESVEKIYKLLATFDN